MLSMRKFVAQLVRRLRVLRTSFPKPPKLSKSKANLTGFMTRYGKQEALTKEEPVFVGEPGLDTADLPLELLESARLEDERRVAEEPGSSSSAAAAPATREEEPPDDFICPITTEVMIDPVMAADGHAYERTAIERWLATKSTSPMTGEALEHTFLSPSHMVRRQIREWQQAHPGG
ncbi:Hypothetical protein EMIHUDRAFT_238964 [Emiliania huxleyi CCMP1516]|uniref:U-box domain-containing protein n=4 Tax=Emiliania huxleyi TaxID=2903 RepID=A0A0D3JKV1_EMIH1|nr:Hypothetical protein EMIHUDRAFT_238964 [Emiliania huxleyi CCMP1516]EOD24136.1 Hypothetical protein EMIHUDRAFT_238964 [Emiliania huxleyi CCMP1516]|eukprot:XP_005776565.1 Hypothetical protein EMIHUDRAFT_238964 [Emiliania huxleyi CCMP1516]